MPRSKFSFSPSASYRQLWSSCTYKGWRYRDFFATLEYNLICVDVLA